MKRQVKNTKKSKTTSTNYTPVEKNIYKVGNSYRVRVNGRSEYVPTLNMARKMRSTLRQITTSTVKIW